MKLLIFVFILASQAYSQSTSMDQYYQDNLAGTPKPGFNYEKPLTGAQEQESANYQSQEFVSESALEACKQLKNSNSGAPTFGSDKYNKKVTADEFDPCNQNANSTAFVFGETFDQMVPMVGKIYGLFGMDSTIKSRETVMKDGKPVTENVDGKEQEKTEEKEKKDYCGKLPLVIEMSAEIYQKVKQDGISQSSESTTPQVEAFYQTARAHEARKQSARIQEYGWGAVAACYAVYIAGGAYIDWTTWAKAAGAGFMVYFYQTKAHRHKLWAEALRNKAKQLADFLKSHNCDPYKEKNCYCSLDSNKMDPNFCLPKPKNKGSKPNSAPVPCVASNGLLDPQCNCIQSQNCIDVGVGQGLNIDFGGNIASNIAKEYSPFGTGGFDTGMLESGNGFANASFAKNTLKKHEKDLPKENFNLNDDQKKQTKMLMNQGIHPLVAAKLASSPLTASGERYMASVKSGASSPLAIPKHNNVISDSTLRFGGNSGSLNKNKLKEDDDFKMPVSKSGANQNQGQQILDFAKKAEQNAEINKSSETKIFDIITHRYRNSAWKKFELSPTEKK